MANERKRPGRAVPRIALGLAVLALPGAAHAQLPGVDSGDTAWTLIAAVLILLACLPGLALFYAGRARTGNALAMLLHCAAVVATVSIGWALAGYSLAFAPGSALIGSVLNLGLANLSAVRAGTNIPEAAFVLLHMGLAMLAAALILGALAERVRFGWLLPFALLWSLIVYAPIAHWIWGGGWLAQHGTRDFAGGLVVQTTAGISALVLALLIGRRDVTNPSRPHSPLLTLTGAGLLWVGWLGLVGGATLSAGNDTAFAMLNTYLAAAAAALSWTAIEAFNAQRPSASGFATGLMVGLASISPAAGYIGAMSAIFLGVAASALCYGAARLVRTRLRIDDALHVFAVNGVGGMLGALLLAPLALTALGGVGYASGTGPFTQFVAQAVGLAAVALWSAVWTLGIGLALSLLVPMRVAPDSARKALDPANHGERGRDFDAP